MYEILAMEDLTSVAKKHEIQAPEVALKARAGQFVIMRIRNRADQELMTRRQK